MNDFGSVRLVKERQNSNIPFIYVTAEVLNDSGNVRLVKELQPEKMPSSRKCHPIDVTAEVSKELTSSLVKELQ